MVRKQPKNRWDPRRGHFVELKRDGGALKGELQNYTQAVPGETPQFSNMSESGFDMAYFQRFLAAERVANNQDSACAKNNNYYVAATPRQNQGTLFTWIPHGVDKSFIVGSSCPATLPELSRPNKAAGGGFCPVAACFQREACRQSYCSIYHEVAALPQPYWTGANTGVIRRRPATVADYHACGTIPLLKPECDHYPPLSWSPNHTAGWTPVMNAKRDCLVAEGQARLTTAADCAAAGAAVLGWTPPHITIVHNDKHEPGCYWHMGELKFQYAGLDQRREAGDGDHDHDHAHGGDRNVREDDNGQLRSICAVSFS